MVAGERTPELGEINREAWADGQTLKWFTTLDGYTDPGERAAFALVSDECRGVPILDIGVGAGRTIPLLRAISEDYVAIDFTPEMVESCNERFPDVRVEQGDARDLGRFADASFGLVVFSWNGIDAVDHADRRTILQEVHRVLRPGGIFFFSTHNKSGPGYDEKPWTIRANDLVHPRHLAEVVVGFPTNVRNHRRLRELKQDQGDWSVANAAAHNFSIVIHYTTLDHQIVELAENGFRPDPVVIENRRARRVTRADDTHKSWWFHLLARA